MVPPRDRERLLVVKDHIIAGIIVVSRAQRIISGEGIGRLWRTLAQGVFQRARAESRLDVITAAYGWRPAVWV